MRRRRATVASAAHAALDDHRPARRRAPCRRRSAQQSRHARSRRRRCRSRGTRRASPRRPRRRAAARRSCAVGERGDPGPHRVELPHVAEVAERRQPRAADRENTRAIARADRTARSAVTYGPSSTSVSTSSAARASPGPTPARSSVRHGDAGDSAVSRCGNALPSVSAPIEHAERDAAPLAEPAGGDLHPRRIHARERHAGHEPQRDERRARRSTTASAALADGAGQRSRWRTAGAR